MEIKEYSPEMQEEKMQEEIRKRFELFPSLQSFFHDNKRCTYITPFAADSVFVYEDGFYEELQRLADALTDCLQNGSLKDRMKSVSFHIKHSVSYIWVPAYGSSFSVSLNSYGKVNIYELKKGCHISSADKEYQKSIKLVFFYNGGIYVERNTGASTKLTPFTVNDLAKIRMFYQEKGYGIVVKLLEDIMTGNAFRDILCQVENRLIYKFPPISFNEINGKHNMEEVMLEKYAGKELIRKIKFNKTDLAVGYMIYRTYNRVNEGSRSILLDVKNHTDMLFKIHDDYYNSCKSWHNEQVFLTDVLYMHIMQYENEASPGYDIVDVDAYLDIFDYIMTCKQTKDKVNLRFRSYKKLMEAHDDIYIKYQNKFVSDITIPANSRFMKLRTMLPEDFEWITTKRRILKEASMMHHCVASYAEKINSDRCAIYSYVDPESGKRYTIEFEKRRGKTDGYKIVQIRGTCNASCPEKIKEYVGSFF